MAEAPSKPTFREAVRFWLKLGLISFGGPTGQIAIMHEELVEKKKWVTELQFLHALNFCMLLPGPEAQQLATYIGWLLHRTRGGILAGSLFVLPAALLLWVLSWVYVTFGEVTWLAGVFHGLKPAVLAIVAAATLRIGRKVLKEPWLWAIASLAFVGIFFYKVPFPLIVLGSGVAGFLGSVWRARDPDSAGARESSVPFPAEPAEAVPSPTFGRAIRVSLICLTLWWLPVLLVGLAFGWQHTLFKEGVFFSKAAMVTFGGVYAVLFYVAQQVVVAHG